MLRLCKSMLSSADTNTKMQSNLLAKILGAKSDVPKSPLVLASPLFRYFASAPGAADISLPVPSPEITVKAGKSNSVSSRLPSPS